MLHIRRAEPATDRVLRAMYAARKSVFVDLLKWDVPVHDGTYEIDQFDSAGACYLILTDEDERHLGSARLLPTTEPHILGSLYPGLCSGAPPEGEHIWEITRFCLDRRLAARERRSVRDTLVCAIAEHALGEGIESCVAIAEFAWFQQILSFGWRCRPLGPPQIIEGRSLGALQIDIDTETPRLLARGGIAPRTELLAA